VSNNYEEDMKHNEIEKKLLLFLEGSLSKEDISFMDKHVKHCEKCEKNITTLKQVWGNIPAPEKAPADQWFKIVNRLDQRKKNSNALLDDLKLAVKTLAYAVVIVAVIFLGNIFGKTDTQNSKENQAQVKIIKELYLDRLNPVPPESIGNISVINIER
jgi:hypothetical protein